MIKQPSLQHEFTLIYSRDPALMLPEAPPDASDEDKAKAAKDAADALAHARRSGDWAPLIRDGGQPTFFDFKDLTRSEISWVYGEQSHSSILGRPLAPPEFTDLLFRIAIRGVRNFGEYKVKRTQVIKGLWLADMNIVDALFEHCGSEPIVEFAAAILKRAEGPDPLS